MNHTPTPWKVDNYGQVLTDPSSGCYETIATTPKAWIDNKLFNQDCKSEAIPMLHEWSARAQANAEFVVRACNAHEELVKQLRDLVDMVSLTLSEIDATQTGWYYQLKQHMQQSRKLLATIEKGA